MRLEIVNRQRLQHAAVVALLFSCVIAFDAAAQSRWQSWPPPTGDKPILLSIETPRCHGCGAAPPAGTSFVPVILDPDEHPRTFSAYLAFAAATGPVEMPLRIVLTPTLDPIAVVRTAEEFREIEARWRFDRDALLGDAGLTFRRLTAGGALKPYTADTPVSRAVGGVDVLRTMAQTAVYDQLGGGFHERARDAEWRVPHFEKSLRDQAVLALAYIDAWQQTNELFFGQIARATLDLIIREFRDPKTGRFYAGLGADSLVPRGGPVVVEGGSYVWQPAEIRHLLGDRAGEVFVFHFGVTKAGDNVLFVAHTPAETRTRFSLTQAELDQIIADGRQKLLTVRLHRPPPPLDTRIITAHNGLAISALARGGIVFGEMRWIEAAVQAARSFAAAKSIERTRNIPARVEDYANLVTGLLDAYDASLDVGLLEAAMAYQKRLDQLQEREAVPDVVAKFASPEPIEDAVTRARATLQVKQVVIVGDRGSEDTKALLSAARTTPGAHVIFLIDSKAARKRVRAILPAVASLETMDRKAAATVCEQGSCRTPTSEPAQIVAWLD